ncbi:MAG: hypothetical protein H5T69_18630, partial [Chloroflexi bacterium]|nr:hypothetical protein [Chloroflexota bacterium]
VNAYWQAQDCAIRFRAYCLEHNLLDFSLTMEVFSRYLLPHDVYRRYFGARYRHLLVDNVEENVPVAQDMLRWAMTQVDSAVLTYELGGGHRVFLGVDPLGASELARECGRTLVLARPFEANPDALAFGAALRRTLGLSASVDLRGIEGNPQGALLGTGGGDYWISMIRWAVERVCALVESGVSPGEIALIAPYVSEVMRFTIEEELAARGIALHLLRPSTPLREDPIIRALLVLCVLAHPQWEIGIQGERYRPSTEDVALVLGTLLDDLDPIRARHLAEEALPPGASVLADLSGAGGPSDAARLGRLWENVGFQVRQHYETLRVWLETYRQGRSEPVDLFLSRIFGDLLSRPGYGFCNRPDRGRAYGRLVESAYKFRRAVALDEETDEGRMARDYVQLILGGIASAEYLLDWPRTGAEEAVILAPAYTYLTRDLATDYQIWLDLGSDGWWNRPNQPLTHPFVLSRHWPLGQPWRDVEEQQANREALGRVVWGLVARCRKGIFLATSGLGIDGMEQDGRLQRAILRVARSRKAAHD